METNSVSKTLFTKYGKKWYFITPDYAFGHTLQQGFEASLKQFGGTEVGASLTPLGATDFSSYLIQAQAAGPDVIIFLLAGQDMVNALKQAVQFGLDKRFRIAGAQQEQRSQRHKQSGSPDRHTEPSKAASWCDKCLPKFPTLARRRP